MDELVCLGAFAGAHGVRGNVRVKSFTEDPEAIASYGPLTDSAGRRRFELDIVGSSRGQLICRVSGIEDRDAALALRGTRLYVPRARLGEPAEEDTFFQADLVGLPAYTPDGGHLGKVRGIADFGAGDVLEVTQPDGQARLVAFTQAGVPEVNIAAGYLVVDPDAAPAEE